VFSVARMSRYGSLHLFPSSLSLSLSHISYHTTHTTKAERRAEKHRQRRGASIGQKTKRGIEGEDPAAAGIEKFFSLKHPREENNVRAALIIFFSFSCFALLQGELHPESRVTQLSGSG